MSAPSAVEARRDAALVAAGVVGVLLVIKHLMAVAPAGVVETLLATAAAGYQLYVPLLWVGRNGVTRASLGLRWDGVAGLRSDLRDFLVAAVVTGVPYALIVHLLETRGFGRELVPAWPPGALEGLFVGVAVVALPEELYFRGLLQERLERLWPARRRVLGAPFGAAVVGAAAVFALVHYVGDYRIGRLATFFPGLVFGLLRARRGSLVAPVLYHAWCNFLEDVLRASHR